MDNNNTSLRQARENKNDEFYTTYESVEEEISHYKAHFLDKTVYCNADNPRISEFSKYFQNNFKELGLKRLIVTSYNREDTSSNSKGLVLDMTDEKNIQIKALEGDGDFRSEECIRLLDESDIVVTNPPFSLMREMISLLESHKKNYLLLATENVLTYKEVFPLVQQGKLWTGYNSGNMNFRVPDDSEAKTNRYWQDEDSQKWRSLGNVIWLTNLETDKHRKRLELTKTYSPEQYPKYDNYDAINVDRIENIPMDYPGVMGVPVTILKKINTEQFEIVGEANHGTDSKFDLFEPKLDGKTLFKKILIKNKSLMENEKIDNKNMPSPERVSFDNKEDLIVYITDYCEKHGWDSDLNHIDTSRISDMSYLFINSKFTGDISGWDTSNVTDMSGMFMYTKFNGDISNWNVSNVTDMSEMFAGTEFNSDISGWDTSKVTDMHEMFNSSEFNQDISMWNTGNVKNMSYMFLESRFNQPIGDWDVSNVTNMEGMFRRSRFNQPLNNWDTSNVTTMQEMFYLSHFNQPIGNWNVSNVKNMSLLFCESRFNQPLDNWKINPSADLSYMFSNSGYSQSLPAWKLENMVNTEGIFKNTPLEGRENELLQKGSGKEIPERVSFDNKEGLIVYITDYCDKHGWDSDLNHIDVSRITDMSDLFDGTKFTGDISKWDTGNVKDMSYMFSDCPFNGDLSKWDVSNVTNMECMFYNSDFNQPINSWNTSKVENMRCMFWKSEFNQPINDWDTSKVENMSHMFEYSKFNQPIGSWDVSSVKDMCYMFSDSRFNQPLDNWKINTSADLSYMFSNSGYSQALPGWKLENMVNTEGIFKNTPLEGRENELLQKGSRKEIPERVSFDNKEDLKAYIEDYCEKHGWDSDLNHIDVSKITDMSDLFADTEFTGDISKWDVSNVKDMSWMFTGSVFNGDISKWDTSNVTMMVGLFSDSQFNQPINEWNTGNVINMSYMFMDSQFNQPLDKWNTSKVTDMLCMFRQSPFIYDLSNWQTGQVRNFGEMFRESAISSIPELHIRENANTALMFFGTPFEGRENELLQKGVGKEIPERVSFETKEDLKAYITDYCEKHGWDSDLNHIDVSKITDMSNLFKHTEFNGDISKWDTSNVQNMSEMFADSAFNQPIGNWNTSKVTNMEFMFCDSAFNQPLNNWDISNVKSTRGMFIGTPFNQPLNKWNVSSVTNMKGMFADSKFDQPINSWDTGNVTNMSWMFGNTPFNQPIGDWDVSNVKRMNFMFDHSLFNQDISKWNVSKGTGMLAMFRQTPFNQDLSNWKVAQNCDMGEMFRESAITTFPQFKVGKDANTEMMFFGTPFEGRENELKNSENNKASMDVPEERRTTPTVDKSLTSNTTTAMEKENKNTVQTIDQTGKQLVILPPAQLLDRALDGAMTNKGMWLNQKSIHSPQIYGYTGQEFQNTLTGFQQALLSLNSQENQFLTNIYATPKEIKENKLRLAGDVPQKGIVITSLDGTTKEYFNVDQMEKSSIKDAYTNIQISRASNFKPLAFAEKDDITRNKELLLKNPASVVIFRKGERYTLYEESALRMQEISDLKTNVHPNTGIVYSSFAQDKMEDYIKAISDSGFRVYLTNSASNFKGTNIHRIEKNAVRDIEKLAANEGFTIGKVTYMPSNYLPTSDTVSLNITGKERSTTDTLREISDIYHSGFEALYSDKRIAGMQKLPMGVRESRKFSQLAIEMATGIQMLRQGLPAVISEDNVPLIPNWQQQLRENPKAMQLLEQHVEALTTAYDRSMRGLKVDYDQLIPTNKNIQKPEPLRPEQGTISRTLGDYTNLADKNFVVIRDKKDRSAIVIFPTGASTIFDKETPGFNKDQIHNALAKEKYNQVYFFSPDAFESLNKPNEFFKNKAVSVEKLHYGKLTEVGKVKVMAEIERTALPEIGIIIPFKNPKTNKPELYIRSTAGEEVTVPITSKKDIQSLANTISEKDRAAANTIRMRIAQKYFVKAQEDPSIVSDYLRPKVPQEMYDSIEKSSVLTDERRDYFINATINGKEYPYKQMTLTDKAIFIASANRGDFKDAIVTRVFAEELGLKVDNKEEVEAKVSAGPSEQKPDNEQEREPEVDNQNEQDDKKQVRRGFHR